MDDAMDAARSDFGARGDQQFGGGDGSLHAGDMSVHLGFPSA
jgi:hypothetical protein